MAPGARRLQNRSSATGLDKEKLFVKLDPVRHAQAAVEIHQIDTATQQHMLAVVDHFGSACGAGSFARYRIRSGAAAKESSGLKDVYLKSGLAQRGGSGEAGQPPPITITDDMRN